MSGRPSIVAASWAMEQWNTPFFLGSIGAALDKDLDYLLCAPHPSSLMCPTDEGWLPLTFEGVDGYLSMLGGHVPFTHGRLSGPRIQRIGVLGEAIEGVGPKVCCDEAGGICEATKHLASHGRRRIAYLSRADGTPEHSSETEARLAGYRRGLAESGLAEDPGLIVPLLVGPDETANNPGWRVLGRRAARRLLERQIAVDAVVCWCDDLAIGAIEQFTAAGKRVPEDVAVVGFDNLRAGRNYDPPLSTVTQPCYAIGYRAMELLMAQLAGSANPSDQRVLPMHLTRRATCGCTLPARGDYGVAPAEQDDALWQLATRVFGKLQDISPDYLRDLSDAFISALRGGQGIVETVGRLMPQATAHGLDSTYAHMYLMSLRDRMARLQAKLPAPLTLQEQIAVARSAAAELSGDYSQLRERIQPQVARLMRRHIQPLARQSNDSSALPQALRQCCIDSGGRFFSLVRNLEGGCYETIRWSADRDGTFEHTTTQGLMSHRVMLSAGDGASIALMQEMRDSDERSLGFLSLDATSPMVPAYPEIADNIGFVLEAMRTHRQLRQASDAKSRFLSSMSHEIRSPMTSILGYTDLLTDDTLSPDERSAYVETIRRNGQHLLHLINDILDLSKIEAGKVTVEKVAFRLDELLADIDSQVRVNAYEKGLVWSIQNLSPLPHKIIGDPTRLRQILLNLTSNAVKFTQSGFARLTVRFSPCLGVLTFQVVDSGIGISAEQMQRLFEPFQQADASVTRRFGGTGLGLAISKRLVQLLGGSLRATSALDEGSTFTVELPVTLPAEAPPADRVEASPKPNGSSRPSLVGRVLLAEDAPDNQVLVTLLLRQAGLEVELACNGAEAVAMATSAAEARAPYDLILMDVQMPELDGLEATRHLRASGYGGAIVALTANALNEDRDNALAAGCDDFLRKPIERSRFYDVLTRFCAARA